jgi:putative oxidoreductase
MKTASLAARILLGLMFTVFGLNGFLHFIPMGPMPTGTAGQFAGALMASHYMVVVSGIQLGTGVLLLLNRFVPLALTLLGPVIVNIVLFHALMAPNGLGMAAFVTVLWLLAAYRVRSVFMALLQSRLPD